MRLVSTFLFILFWSVQYGQTGSVTGQVNSENTPLAFAQVLVFGSDLGTTTSSEGRFTLEGLAMEDSIRLEIYYTGFETQSLTIYLSEEKPNVEIEIDLKPSNFLFDQVVVTGTKTFKRQTESAVIVNVIDNATLNQVQACNLAEGLRFQPGLRVETDCQTCNYTQLRMNGLGGSYSQILINGRPVFSPLTGLYGLEQIPSNMIERIEVVRGGGSALYGSSAIGGTVNVITKLPKSDTYELTYNYQNINGNANDQILNGAFTQVNDHGNFGASVFFNSRVRDFYDHNGDRFSELPKLNNKALGTNLFFQPTENQKLEFSGSYLYEYRFGGEITNDEAFLAQQSEERTHHVWMGNMDYQINFNQDQTSLIAYLAGQYTDRDHFTGVQPDDSLELVQYLIAPPYGTSRNTTWQAGLQLNHRLDQFLGGSNMLTIGAEYLADDVLDEIEAYRYLIDQTTKNLGFFAQSDWEILPQLNLLTGIRIDQHNLVDGFVLNPRISLLYKLKNTTQFRLAYSTGFRAPQAFDTDLHIAFAGGGVSRISLADDLESERSQSVSASVNFDKASEKWIGGFTLEGFYTRLNEAFFLAPLGEDEFGERFEKQNGDFAHVQGITLELRANYLQKVQLEAGWTIQSSLFGTAVENLEGLEPSRRFLRTPNSYGYQTLRIMPGQAFETTFNMVYTGSMDLLHLAGAPEQLVDELFESPDFWELSWRSSYRFPMPKLKSNLVLFGGIKNMTNAYQSDFDTGKNRDSNYVYGPSAPRTFFIGLQLKSL